MKDLEIIIVNDGSTDSMREVCERYAAEHSNIQVIHQDNRGVSAARNAGLHAATGEFVMFLDADDYFVSGVLSDSLRKELEQSQADVWMFSSYGADRRRKRFSIDMRFGDRTLPGRRIYPAAGTFGSCIYRRDMLISNQIEFDEGVSLNEDQVFKMKALYMATVIRTSADFCYVYCDTPGSIMHTGAERIDRVYAWRCAYDWFVQHVSEEEQARVLPYIQVKIQSRLLLYAKHYVQGGHGEQELRDELQRIDGLQLLESIDASQVMPYQREELRLFQTDRKAFIALARRGGWKIRAERALLRVPVVRWMRDRKRYPLKNLY